MHRSTTAYVTPAALRWARESMGFSVEEAAEKSRVSVDALAAAESGDGHLTLRQAEDAARIYQRPLAALFLPEPPQEETPETQFRRLQDAPRLPWPPEMIALVRRIRVRQDEAEELYEALEAEAPWTSFTLDAFADPTASAERLRTHLVDLVEQMAWRDRSGYRPLREWVDAVESLGILVMQDGTMTVEAMRGFASDHPSVPAIVVNTNDDPRARAFTIVHELAHLILARTGHPAVNESSETWCNAFAAEILMPRAAFVQAFRDMDVTTQLERVDALALSFGVTPHAAVVRLRGLETITRAEFDELRAQIQERSAHGVAKGGGNYYRNVISHLGPTFIQLVLSALDRQAVTLPAASGLLGVKVNNLEKLRETVLDRAGTSK